MRSLTSSLVAATLLALAPVVHAQDPDALPGDVPGQTSRAAGASSEAPAALVPLTVWADAGDGVTHPHGAEQVADGTVLVVEYDTNTILRFSATGVFLSTFATSADGLSAAFGIEQLADGSILVASYGNNTVLRFSADGNSVSTFANSSDGLSGPREIVQLADETVLVVSSENNTVYRFSADGSVVSVFANNADGLLNPIVVDELAGGSVVVTSSGNSRVYQFSADGSVISVFANSADGLSGPWGLKVLFDGTVLVASRSNDRILQFSADGSTVSTFAGTGDGVLDPTQIDQLVDGTVLIVDHDRLEILAAPGPPPSSEQVLYAFEPPVPDLGSQFGASVAAAGDLDGDTHRDLIVGQVQSGTDPRAPGRAFLYSGGTGALLRTLQPPAGQQSAGFGSAVDAAGDVDGDGLRDILVGAPERSPGAAPTRPGYVYLFSGATGALLRTFAPPDASPLAYSFGAAVVSIDDLNGNGSREFAVGAPYVPGATARVHVFDPATGVRLYTLIQPVPEADGRYATTLASPGDVDGDGVRDLAVGAPGEGTGALPNGAGRVHVYSGTTGTLLYSLASPNPEKYGYFGVDMASAGNVDGDGRADVLIGAEGEEPLQAADRAEGRAYVFSGRTGALLRTLYVADPTGRGRFGHAVESGDDLDGDAVGELLVGAPDATAPGAPSESGRVFVFSAATGALLFDLVSPEAEMFGSFGQTLGPLRDVNGDELADVVVAAPYDGAAGRVYVFGEPVVPQVSVVTLRPTTPIAIPAAGGSVEVKHRLMNEGEATVTFETWAVLTRPNGTTVLVSAPKSVVLAPGDPVGRKKTIVLASNAQAGAYVLTRYVGTYPNEVFGQAAYAFSKSATAAGPVTVAVGAHESAAFVEGLAEDEGAVLVTAEGVEALVAGSSVEAEVAPVRTALLAPSPNPTGGRATVRYDLSVATRVRVAVFDVLGREVAVLVDGEREVGSHAASLDGSRLAAGVYVVRLTAGAVTQTRRLTLTR